MVKRYNGLKKGIAGAIVIYNPDDLERLYKCMNSVLKQVAHLYIFDNSTKEFNLCLPDCVTYISEKCNKGIAYALNRLMEQAKKDEFTWVLTVDQDSIIPDDMVSGFKEYMNDDRIGVICPQVIDKRRKYMSVSSYSNKVEQVDMCITSASCTSVYAWSSIGKFDEWLFIDLVDNDFCKRLKIAGYKILKVNKWILDQKFGDIKPKNENIERFWIKIGDILHNDNFAKFSYKKIVHPIRVYYTCRNIIYLNKKFKYYGGIGYKENYNCNSFIGFLICFVLPSILRSNNKISTIKAVVKGFKDGRVKEVNPWMVESIS